jgi:hypothetical protein
MVPSAGFSLGRRDGSGILMVSLRAISLYPIINAEDIFINLRCPSAARLMRLAPEPLFSGSELGAAGVAKMLGFPARTALPG